MTAVELELHPHSYIKQTSGWRTIPRPQRVVQTITPTGHRYTSRPPPAVGQAPPRERASPTHRHTQPQVMEQNLPDLLLTG